MAERRPNVPMYIRDELVSQANGKCANPGCPNRLLELHHIREWHIYKTHDADHMVAICASCHDSVDRGTLRLTDDEVYIWKGIRRDGVTVGHIFVEPSDEPPRILLGTISVQGTDGLVAFDFSDSHKLSFAVRDGDIMLMNLRLSSSNNEPLVEIIDGYVRTRDPSIEIRSRPGRIYIAGGINSRFIPQWVRQRLLNQDTLFGIEGMPLLEVSVIRPNLVRVNGIWCSADACVIATRYWFSFVHPERSAPLTLAGEGEDTILHYTGPIGTALFGV